MLHTTLYRFLTHLFEDVLHLFFPRTCWGCEAALPHGVEHLCVACRGNLHPTGLHHEADNILTQRFWGRVAIEQCAACYRYQRGTVVQKLIYGLKYQHQPEIGQYVGNVYGRALAESPHFSTVDAIVPVPLHPRKLRIRGYNQSAEFGQGLSDGMGVVQYPNGLVRNAFTSTQTRKSRLERFANVERVFEVSDEKALRGKHILLIDDVMTTGATLENCANVLLALGNGTRVSIATIAATI